MQHTLGSALRRHRFGLVAVTAAATIGLQLAAAPTSGAAAPERPGPAHTTKQLRDEPAEHPLPLTLRYSAKMHGGITRIANTLMSCDESKKPLLDTAPDCETARKGEGEGIYNNNYPMKYVNAFPGEYAPAHEKIYSSSGAKLNIPAGSTVKYARLYWGGTRGIKNVVLPLSQVDGVLFKTPDGKDYHEVNSAPQDLGWMTGLSAGEHGYQASADVTDLVRASGNGEYVVADMDSVVQDHSWGGWSLVVAYENCDKPYRDVHLWDGFTIELPGSAPMSETVSGLDIPKSGPVDGRLGFISYDGDRTYRDDSVYIKTPSTPNQLLEGPDNPGDDIMNSTITDNAGTDVTQRTPNYVNQFGYDSDRFDISKYVRNGDDSMTFTFDTKLDGYQVGAIYSTVNLNG